MTIKDYRWTKRSSGMKVFREDKEDDSMVLDTQYSMMKQLQEATHSYTFPSNVGEGTTDMFSVNHGLSYIPSTMIFSSEDIMGDGSIRNVFLPKPIREIKGMLEGVCIVEMSYYVDETKIQFYITKTYYGTFTSGDEDSTNMNGKTFRFKIYIFADAGA